MIEESKDISKLNIKELQGSLEVWQMRLNSRNPEKSNEQALQAQYSKKGKDQKQWKKKGNFKNSTENGNDKPESSSKGGGHAKTKNKGKFADKKKGPCWNCDKMGHFANECWSDKGKQKKIDDHKECLAQGEDSNSNIVTLMAIIEESQEENLDHDSVTVMATVTEESLGNDKWFLDTGCSNHMTCHSEGLTDLDTSKRSKVRFADV